MEINLTDIIKIQKSIKMQMKVIDNAIKSAKEEANATPRGVFAVPTLEVKDIQVEDKGEAAWSAQEEAQRTEEVQSPKDLPGEPDLDLIEEQQAEVTGL